MNISISISEITYLHNLLQKYKDERGLTLAEQKKGLRENLKEERDELFHALLLYDGEDTTEIIDAFCDIFVFCLNAFNYNDILNDDSYDIDLYNINTSKYLNNLDFVDGILNDDLLTLVDLYAGLKAYSKLYSYDFYKAMQETIKEISSRTGKWDNKRKKFIKDTSDEAKAKWYKANYNLARIGNEN